MKLTVIQREGSSKGEVSRLRREGKIPAVVYGKGQQARQIAIDAKAFELYLRDIKSGEVSTARFSLEGEGVQVEAIIKEIQYHPTTYAIEHVDFMQLQPDVKVNVRIPLRWTRVAECPGVKLGGVLRAVIRTLPVRCYPKDMPVCFELDVGDMSLAQSKRLSSVTLPAGVRPLCDLNEVAVVVAKR